MSNNSSKSGDFTYINSGTNSQGNHYCTRDYGDAGQGYHYSNNDGSYYYKNPNGSTYHNDGNGSSKFTTPNGHTITKSSK